MGYAKSSTARLLIAHRRASGRAVLLQCAKVRAWQERSEWLGVLRILPAACWMKRAGYATLAVSCPTPRATPDLLLVSILSFCATEDPGCVRGAGRPLPTAAIGGIVVGAVALMALGVLGVLLVRRLRRSRRKYVFDEPSDQEYKKGTSGTNGTTGTSDSSAISAELRKAAFHIDPKDIVIEQNEHGNVLLGRGAFGEVRAAAALGSHLHTMVMAPRALFRCRSRVRPWRSHRPGGLCMSTRQCPRASYMIACDCTPQRCSVGAPPL